MHALHVPRPSQGVLSDQQNSVLCWSEARGPSAPSFLVCRTAGWISCLL
eukprot:COSAG01_NODE_1930_length_8875_cov_10.550365_8_plen_49_part_00